MQLFNAFFVMKIRRVENGNERPRIEQDTGDHFLRPKPCMCFLLVLRSRGPALMMPIKPAFLKASCALRDGFR